MELRESKSELLLDLSHSLAFPLFKKWLIFKEELLFLSATEPHTPPAVPAPVRAPKLAQLEIVISSAMTAESIGMRMFLLAPSASVFPFLTSSQRGNTSF